MTIDRGDRAWFDVTERWQRLGVQEEVLGRVFRPENLQRLSAQVTTVNTRSLFVATAVTYV